MFGDEVAERSRLIELLQEARPLYGNEELIRQKFLDLVIHTPNCAMRESLPAHLTASAWVITPDRTECLLIYHRKLGIWVQPGGHADGDFNLVDVAKREVSEETGVNVELLCEQESLQPEFIFDLDIHDIPARADTPEHQHYDVRFLFTAAANSKIVPNEELVAAKWVKLSEVEHYTTERSVLRMRDKCIKGNTKKLIITAR